MEEREREVTNYPWANTVFQTYEELKFKNSKDHSKGCHKFSY